MGGGGIKFQQGREANSSTWRVVSCGRGAQGEGRRGEGGGDSRVPAPPSPPHPKAAAAAVAAQGGRAAVCSICGSPRRPLTEAHPRRARARARARQAARGAARRHGAPGKFPARAPRCRAATRRSPWTGPTPTRAGTTAARAG